MESPLRFQAVVATVAIAGAVLLVDEPPPVRADFVFQDVAIDESSGLVDLGSTVLTVNDSGDGPVVYVVDASTGTTVGRTTYTDDDVVDVEALAVGPGGSTWVGDIGDNGARRMAVAVYELPPVAPGERTVTARRYDLQYRGGPRDAEALLVHPESGRLFVVSKGLFGGQVFAAPEELRADQPNLLTPVGRTGGLVTDGAFFPDGRHALLRSYSTASVHDTARWRSPASMRLPDQPQGEGLAMSASGRRVLVSSEGERTKVLSVALSRKVLAAATARGSGEGPTAPPAPPAAPASAAPSTPHGGDGYSAASLVGLCGAALAAVFGVRALLRLRGSRPRSRPPR